MACTVTTEEITSRIKNSLLNVGGVIPTGNTLFESFTTKNPSGISETLSKQIKAINIEYLTDIHGEVLKTSKGDYGTTISIMPSQALADAMTKQNFEDDARIAMKEDSKRAGVEYDDNNLYDSPRKVNYNLKSIPILQSDKGIATFAKGEKAGWTLDKILTELQVPKEQKKIILDRGLTTREEIITSLLAENSFTVEINITKEKNKSFNVEVNQDGNYEYRGRTFFSRSEAEEAQERYGEEEGPSNSKYYQNLTVPGGTNYTENEIATPDIVPNIKGHGKFSTNNGIGWFRSDDMTYTESYVSKEATKSKGTDDFFDMDFPEERSKRQVVTEIRRVLEVQSDLFQKGRDAKTLADDKMLRDLTDEQKKEIRDIYKNEGQEAYDKAYDRVTSATTGNSFLQLLNQKGNWVQFFIQSIVQDSVAKGYKKVLFPTGETAAKVEGHQTLANEIVKLDADIARINTLQIVENVDYESKNINKYKITDPSSESHSLEKFSSNNKKDLENKIEESIKNKEKAKKDMKTQGLEKLKPIEAFYTNRVANTLNKLYETSNITDEHGNTWIEVNLENEKNNSENIYFSKRGQTPHTEAAPEKPIGNNYVEFVRYKQERLQEINNKLGRLNFALSTGTVGANTTILEVNREIKELSKESSTISRQLEALAMDKPKYMFHAIIEDLGNLKRALTSNNVVDVRNISSKLNFYEDFIKGEDREYKGDALDLYEHPDFKKMIGTVGELQIIADRKINETARATIENSDAIYKLKMENPTVEMDSLFQATNDISWLETYTLGVTADRTDNTVIPQALKILLETTYIRKESTIKTWNKELARLVKNDPSLDNPEFIKEKGEDKQETGFIIDLFSPAYHKAMGDYRKALKDFRGLPNKQNYIELVSSILKNNDTIDFTKLKSVRDQYGTTYSQHFTSSDAEMDAYEQKLKDTLGVKYEEMMEQLQGRLALFEERKIDALSERGEYSSRDLASQDIWKFNERMKGPATQRYEKMLFNIEGDTRDFGVTFRDFNSLTFIPKAEKTVEKRTNEGFDYVTESTGFYSSEFQTMAKDQNKLDYWKLIKKMSEYVSSTYDAQTFGRLTYPKLQREYAERLQEGIKDKAFGRIIANSAKEYKGWFFEKGRDDKTNKVAANYQDSFQRDKMRLADSYKAQGIDKEVAMARANKELLESYSGDFNSNMIAVAMEAALHDARMEVQPMAEAYMQFFKSVDPTRTNAIKKLEHFYEKIILNKTEKYRGSGKAEGKTLSKGTIANRGLALMETVPFIKKFVDNRAPFLLSDAEAKIFKQLKIIQKKGGTTADYSFSFDGITYSQKDGKTYETVGQDTGPISQEAFQREFNNHIERTVNDLGIDLNLAGVINGILKTVIFKGLAINPISGIFNRIEGKHSSMIMDATGEYWQAGDIMTANNLMQFANITRLSKGRLSPLWGKRKKTLQTFEVLMKQFNILQDRKNELQRSAEEANFSRELFNPYMFAVENPEYKNQGAIVMAVLMDTYVTHPVTGEQVAILDRDSGEFSIHDFKNGVVSLKPEFQTPEIIASYENFESSEFQHLLIRMTDAVSRSQGNYDARDIMMLKKGVWGRAATLFMTWFAEHVNQRFGRSGENNYNLVTGEKRKDGRFIGAYKANKFNTIVGGAIGMGIAYGAFGPLIAAAGFGALGIYVYKKRVKTLADPNHIKREANNLLEAGSFLVSILIESLNYPGRFLNQGDIIKNKTFEKSSMTKDEVASMRALTRELAISLTWLAAKLAMGALMYDDEDDKESPQRMKHNFVQNQMSRAINTLIMYANPYELVSDQSRIAAVDVIMSVMKVVMSLVVEEQREELPKNLLDASPVPRILTKGTLPWHNTMNYDEMSNFDKIPSPMKWTSELYKDNAEGPERQAKSEYNDIRTAYRKKLRAEYMKESGGKKAKLKAAVDKTMDKEMGKKKKGQTYAEKVKELKAKGFKK